MNESVRCLCFFDIRTGKKEVINVKLSLYRGKITNSEKFVEKYYKLKSYEVVRLDPTKKHYYILSKNCAKTYLEDNFIFKKEHVYDNWGFFCSSVGAPDFLVYKIKDEKIVELFFVEVKNLNDGVKFNQFKWFYSTDAPIKVVFMNPDGFLYYEKRYGGNRRLKMPDFFPSHAADIRRLEARKRKLEVEK